LHLLYAKLCRDGRTHHEQDRWPGHKLKPNVDTLSLTPTALNNEPQLEIGLEEVDVAFLQETLDLIMHTNSSSQLF